MKRDIVVIVLGTVVLAMLAMAAVMSITGPRSTREARGCATDGGALGDYQATVPTRAVTDAAFLDGTGGVRTLAEWRGSGVVLNFWATWCAPCVREMPALDRLRSILDGDGIAVLALSVDRGETRVVEDFYEKHVLRTLDVLTDKRRKLLTEFAVRGLPTTVLIDGGGYEVGRVVGAAEWDGNDAVAFLRRCLAPPPAPTV